MILYPFDFSDNNEHHLYWVSLTGSDKIYLTFITTAAMEHQY